MSSSSASATSNSFTRYSFFSGLLLGGVLIGGIAGVIYWLGIRQTPDRLIQQGQEALSQRDWPRAVDFGEEAVRLVPDSTAAWKLLAEAAFRHGDLDRSLTAVQQSSRAPSSEIAKLAVKLGSEFMKRNRIPEARSALRCAAEADFDAFEPYRLLAQIAGVTGRPKEVQACLIELIRRKAFTRDDLLVLGSMNPIISDPKHVEDILKVNPEDPSPLLANALDALNINRVDEAESLLTKVVSAHPEDLYAQGVLGEVYADFFPDRFDAWHAALPETADWESRIWLARGKWLSKQGKPQAAIRCLHEALRLEPEILSATALLAQLLVQAGETDLGTSLTERARLLQRILDLNTRMKEPHAASWIAPLIKDLESAGQLWEAWAWSTIHCQIRPRDRLVMANRDRLSALLSMDLPRTNPDAVLGGDFDWDRYPLPSGDFFRAVRTPSGGPASPTDVSFRFDDAALNVGLDFRYVNSYSPQVGRRIFESMGAGVGVLDYDRDGWPDLYFPQGNTSPADSTAGPSDELYRNLQGNSFSKVTESAGIQEPTYSQGVAVGDYDNDGFPDVYVANLGRNRLYRNNGDGTFSDVTDLAGLKQKAWTVSCAIADLSGDGLPELFDVNYVEGEDFLLRTCRDERNRPVVCRPTVFPPAWDTVTLNNGSGGFQELQAEAGLDLPQGMGLGLVIADFNQDRRLDVFVANDQTANYLLMNEPGKGSRPLWFRDEAHVRGAAFDGNGLAQACMGIACADLNHDGFPDLYVTNFARESNTLYVSQPGGYYQDQTQEAGLRGPSFEPLGFGTQFADIDNDGIMDLFVLNGHIDELVDVPFRMKAQIFRGLPDKNFQERFSQEVGDFLDLPRLGRGLARVDWNRDTKWDFVATDLEGPVLLATNRTDSQNYALRLHLVGTESNRDAIGTVVTATLISGDVRIFHVAAGDGYESRDESTVHFGTGSQQRIERLQIDWPSGRRSQFESVSCDGEWIAIESRDHLLPMKAD